MRKKGSYHKNRPFRLLVAAALRFVQSYLNDIDLTGDTSNMCSGGFYASFYAQKVATCCAAGSAGSTVSAVRIGPTPL